MATEDVRVVVVDDHADTCEAVRKLLELDGYNVRTASNGREAMAVIAEHRPICVILDLGLPDAAGVDLARRLRTLHGTGTVIIVLTGSTRPEDQAAAESAGADYVLHKPLDVAQLRKMLPRIE
jgi:DNA-binding response OmpR family regulator